jgi:hypothetical protein
MFLAQMDMYRAHQESKRKSDWLTGSWKGKRLRLHEKPATSWGPPWLRLNKETGEWEKIPDRVAAVLRMFELARDGYGSIDITNRLPREHFAPFNPKARHWCSRHVAQILANKAVIGEFQPHRKVNGKRVPVGDPIKDY